MDVNGKRILVVGLGMSGEAAAKLLILKGASVLAIDESQDKTMKRKARRKRSGSFQMQFGVKTLPSGRFDAAILSPGVHPRRGIGLSVSNLDIPIYGEFELGSWFCECPIIAITGTNGKTTTTELVEKAIRANRKKIVAAGNIGVPMSQVALQSDQLDYIAAEASSFQLETIERFRPKVSVLMNITPDHLDRYASVDEYARAKAAIWKNQCGNDIAIVNWETEKYLAGLGYTSPVRTIRYSLRPQPGADLWFDGEAFQGSIVEKAKLNLRLDQTRLRGIHNAENIMAAIAVVDALGLDLAKAWKVLSKYQAPSHRLETVGIFQGIEFVNDSKATNIDAMEKAIRSFAGPVILIAGGKDKGFDFTGVAPLIREKVKSCILIGEMQERMFQAWGGATSCHRAGSLEEAVQKASNLGKQGDVVLLSPGCSSYDMFKNYEERGDLFRSLVRQLQQPKPSAVS